MDLTIVVVDLLRLMLHTGNRKVDRQDGEGVDEQVVTGTIEENEDGSYSITDEGRFIVSMFRMMSEWFDTDRRLVYPNEY